MDSKDLKKGWKKCEICNKTFVNISNFRAHIKLKHPDDAEKIDAGAKPTAKCNVCNKAIDKRYLTRHLKFKHPEVEEASSSKKMYDCTLCHKKFDTLHASLKQNHKCLKMLRCSLCEYENTSQEEVISHMKTLHSIAINSQNLTFDSIEKFEQWKTELEKDTVSKYNISHGSYGTKKYKRSQYYCQRSGYYIARGKQLRHLKSQGSKKINGFCPSKIDCRQEGEKCSVTFISTHVGHAADLGHLFLTSTERQELAIKVAQKIPFQFILDEIRESVYDDNLERIHLLKKKDLYNIERDFQLNNDSCRHTNDAISVETWVNQMRPTGCVLFYKPQGSPCSSSSELNSEDFVIVIMTQGQQELLNKFGEDCVCIDGTHGVNGYGFELHTLLVLDDLREGYPTAFLISSRVDEHVMTLFFSCVKDKLGKSIKPSVFMSDMADTYYNAWLNVMQPAKHRLYCTWHIDRAWRKNLSKVSSQEKRVVIYKIVRTLLQERDVEAFSIMIQQFLDYCSKDSDTAGFGTYFKNYYLPKVKNWAYCYRLNAGLNTNMHIERMHRTIKYLYLNGKYNKRMDKAIMAIMKFVRDKIFERIIAIHKGKICSKLCHIRARHNASKQLNIAKVIEKECGWEVPSDSTNEIYMVDEIKSNCVCQLACDECKSCLHQYSCNCLDSSIKWNMCKHIHLVCTYRKQKSNVLSGVVSEIDRVDNSLIMHTDAKEDEALQLVQAISNNYNPSMQERNFFERKSKLIKDISDILEIVTNLNDVSDNSTLETISKFITPVKPTLEASSRHKETLKELKVISTNKNISKQSRFFAVKKSLKAGAKRKILPVPSPDEANSLALQLILNKKLST